MSPAIVLANVAVVIDPILVAGVVGRIDVDHTNLSAVRGAQETQRIEIVAFYDEIRKWGVFLFTVASVAKVRHNTREHHMLIDCAIAI